jgi:plasmid stabilization system protein ParE
MSYRIKIHKLAAQDMLHSIVWYKDRSLQAANNFQKELKDVFSTIQKKPFLGRNRYRSNYEIRMKKFPFSVVYLIVDQEITISAVYHDKRNPSKKYRDI